MAKGSFLGVKRGKLGDAVGYNVTNSSDKEKQGWRAYQPVVRNPQSDGQIDQRVKLQAVNNLYRALKPIIQRGWENHKYGDESRRAFLKRALGSAFAGPYIEKGSTLAVPIEGVPITYGSLPPVVVDCPGGGEMPTLRSVTVPGSSSIGTMGAISTVFINSGMAQAGDQVTLLFGWVPDTTEYVVYKEISFIIDPNDVREPEDAIGVLFSTNEIEGVNRLCIDEFSEFDYDAYDYCFLCSISRNGDNANLRSYAEFAMTSSFRAKFYGNAQQNAAAKRSYRRQQSADTNWPLVPGGGGGYTPVVQSAFTRAGTEFTPVGIRVVDPGQNQYLCIYDGADNNYYIESYESSSGSMRAFLTGTGATSTAQPTGMTTANSCDVYDTNNVAAGLRAWLISKGVSPTVLPVRS